MKNFTLKVVLLCGLLSALILPARAMEDEANLEGSHPSKLRRMAPNINPDPANPYAKKVIPCLFDICVEKIGQLLLDKNFPSQNILAGLLFTGSHIQEKILNKLSTQQARRLYVDLSKKITPEDLATKDFPENIFFRLVKEKLENQKYTFQKNKDGTWTAMQIEPLQKLNLCPNHLHPAVNDFNKLVNVFNQLIQHPLPMNSINQITDSLENLLKEGIYTNIQLNMDNCSLFTEDEGKIIAASPVKKIQVSTPSLDFLLKLFPEPEAEKKSYFTALTNLTVGKFPLTVTGRGDFSLVLLMSRRSYFNNLTYLSLSDLRNNSITLLTTVPFCNLEYLILSDNDFGQEGGKYLSNSNNFKKLRVLNLMNVKTLNKFPNDYDHAITDENITAFAQNPNFGNLIRLNLGRGKMGNDGLKAIIKSQCLTNLQKLEVPDNNFTNVGLIEVFQTPSTLIQLQTLALWPIQNASSYNYTFEIENKIYKAFPEGLKIE